MPPIRDRNLQATYLILNKGNSESPFIYDDITNYLVESGVDIYNDIDMMYKIADILMEDINYMTNMSQRSCERLAFTHTKSARS
jgi:hypothetical protein